MAFWDSSQEIVALSVGVVGMTSGVAVFAWQWRDRRHLERERSWLERERQQREKEWKAKDAEWAQREAAWEFEQERHERQREAWREEDERRDSAGRILPASPEYVQRILRSSRFCGRCGCSVPKEADYCPNCGASQSGPDGTAPTVLRPSSAKVPRSPAMYSGRSISWLRVLALVLLVLVFLAVVALAAVTIGSSPDGSVPSTDAHPIWVPEPPSQVRVTAQDGAYHIDWVGPSETDVFLVDRVSTGESVRVRESPYVWLATEQDSAVQACFEVRSVSEVGLASERAGPVCVADEP